MCGDSAVNTKIKFFMVAADISRGVPPFVMGTDNTDRAGEWTFNEPIDAGLKVELIRYLDEHYPDGVDATDLAVLDGLFPPINKVCKDYFYANHWH